MKGDGSGHPSSGTALAQWPGMLTDETPYYAEISILVDGWPWNLSEFDFRRWLAPGVASSLLETVERMSETRSVEHVPALSENRRVAEPGRGRRRKRSGKHPIVAAAQSVKPAKKHKYGNKHGRKVA